MEKKEILTNEIISEIDNDNNSFSDNEKEENAEDIQVSKEFQENVIKYVKYDDAIRKKQDEVTELKKKRKPCEEYILKYLDNVGENLVEITDGKLRKNKSETKAPLSQDIIKNAISQKVNDPIIIEEILKSMENLRPLNTHVNIKRTSIRPSARGKKKVRTKKE